MKKNDARIRTLADSIINQCVTATILVEYDGVVTYSAYYIEQDDKIFLNSSKSVISAISPLILQMLRLRGCKNLYSLKHDNTLEGLEYALSFEGIDLEFTVAGNTVTIRLSKGIW